MELIIEFYQGLDALNLIIFWGIIIVIILLIILAFILINKNKKLKKIVNNNIKADEELPIKNIETENNNNFDKNQKEIDNKDIILTNNKKVIEQEETKHIETEQKFIAEEHIKKYNEQESKNYDNNKNTDELKNGNFDNKKYISKEIEIPTKPYQKNVLREMSLSQTSPIGITRPINKEDKKLELAKDLEDSLNKKEEETKEIASERNNIQNEILKKELSRIEEIAPRKTEIKEQEKNETKNIITKKEYNSTFERKTTEIKDSKPNNPYFTKFEEMSKIETPKVQINIENKEERKNEENKNEYIPLQVKELLEKTSINENNVKSSSERYLEEVSKKLAEAEIPDEIERTEYELEQEENAIISYKELMEKKDSIQTIDEEDAIISIEELMNKSTDKSQKKEEPIQESKLYNISEEEDDENFLKELKQFRNDL